jgi:small conductance mechanosensitive channel
MDLNLAQATAEMGTFATLAWAWAIEFLPRLGVALVILVFGYTVAGWASRIVRLAFDRTRHIDQTLEPIAATAARYAVLILVFIAALGQLGIQTTSLLTVLGAAGLAIGLALQGTLTNIAAGIMLLYLRPVRAGDTIETPVIIGKVKEIGLFATTMETLDGLFYFVPNSALWNVPLKNQTRNPRRMVTIILSVSYASDLAAVRRMLLELAAADERILKDPPPTEGVESYTDTRIVVGLRAWVYTSAFGDVQRDLAEQAKTRLEAAGIKMPV